MVDGVSFTQRERALEPLTPGTKVLCLLQIVGGKKMIAGMDFGVFSLISGRITPLTKREDFAPEYRGADYEEATHSMLGHLASRKH